MKTSQRDYPLRIGAAGWDHPAWTGAFYPDDLPADWRLVYYANEFPVVLVPAAVFAAADRAALEDWREAAETGMRLLFELDPARSLDAQRARAAELETGCLGLILPASDPARLVTQLDCLGDAVSVVADFGAAGAAEPVREMLSQRGVGWCWHGEGPADGLAPGPLGVMRVPSRGADPRRLRGWLEAGLAVQDGQRDVALIFDDDPPDVDILRQAQTLLELL